MSGWFRDEQSGAPVFQTDSGKFLLKKGGSVVHVDQKDLGPALLTGGYEPASPAELAAHESAKRVEKEGVTGYLKTGAEAAAAGAFDAATFPARVAARAALPEESANALEEKALSGRSVMSNLAAIAGDLWPGDQSGEAVARGYTEAARQRAQDRPGTALAGRIAGELATGAATGGGLAAASEHAAEQAGVGALGRALTRTAGMAAESGGHATTQASEDAWVGDTKLTGEAVAADAMAGFLGGALMGASTSGLGALARKAFGRPVTSPVVTKAADEAVSDMVSGIAGAEAEPAAVSYMRQQANKAARGIEDVQSRLTPEADREVLQKYGPFAPASKEYEAVHSALRDYEGTLTRNADELSAKLNKAESNAEHVRELWDSAEMKKDALRPLITADHEAAVVSARKFGAQLRDYVSGTLDEVENAGNSRVNTALRKYIGDKIESLNTTDDAAQAFTDLYQIKQAVQRTKKLYSNAVYADPNATQAARTIAGNFDQAQNWMRDFTENELVWGKAGAATKEVNAAYTNWLKSADVYNETMMKTTQRAGWGGPVQEAWDEKVRSFLSGVGTGATKQRESYVRNYVAGLKNLVDTMGKHFDAPEGALSAASENAAAALRGLDETKATLGAANQIRAIQAAEGGSGKLSGTAGAVIGGMLGGPAGAAVGGTVGHVLGRPATLAMQAAQLRAVVAKQGARVSGIAADLVKPVEKALRPVASVSVRSLPRAAARATVAAGVAAAATAKERDSQYREVANRLIELQTNPQILQDTVISRLGDQMPDFPQTSGEVTATTARAVSFLSEKLPAPLQTQPGLTPMKPQTVAPAERSRFMRYVEAAKDPDAVLAKVGDGSITDEHVEAVKNIYPAKFEFMRTAIIETIAGGKADAPYQVRLRLQKLFDAPVDPTTKPGFAEFIQASVEQSVAADGQKRAARGGGGKAPNVSKSLAIGSPQTLHL